MTDCHFLHSSKALIREQVNSSIKTQMWINTLHFFPIQSESNKIFKTNPVGLKNRRLSQLRAPQISNMTHTLLSNILISVNEYRVIMYKRTFKVKKIKLQNEASGKSQTPMAQSPDCCNPRHYRTESGNCTNTTDREKHFIRGKKIRACASTLSNFRINRSVSQPTREIVDLSFLQNVFAIHLVTYPYAHDKGFLKIR